jgi:hypothetical protein
MTRLWNRTWFWPLAFACYFLIQLDIRMVLGSALELDEAEALYFARHLALGYGAQPPLYFWLQWSLFQLFGEGVLALAILKAGLLTTGLVVLYRLLLKVAEPVLAGIGAASLSLLPQIVWEAQRALTHSVLVLVLAIVLCAVFWRVLERGWWRDYLVLGVVIGLGLLSKYNFALLPVGLALAAALMPELRGRLNGGRLAVAVMLAAALVAPSAFWALNHPELAGGSVHKLGLGAAGPLWGRISGTGAFVVGLAGFLGVAIVVLGAFAWARERGQVQGLPLLLRFLGWGAVAALGVLWLALLIAGATEVKDRWLMPLAWVFVPVAVVWLWPALREGQRKGLAGIVLGLWLLAMLALPYATLRDPGYRAADFRALMEAVEGVQPGTETVVSESVWILGNLAYARPDLTLARLGALPEGGFVLVSEAGSGAVERAGLEARAGVPVAHDLVHGARVMAVEIRTVAP